jgi:beta-lactamase regulating signal transducer with metallopeptidase domain
MNNAFITILSLSVSGSLLALVLLRLVVPISVPVNMMDSLFGFGMENPGVNSTVTEQTGLPAGTGTMQIDGQTAVPFDTQTLPAAPQQNKAADSHRLSSVWNLVRDNLFWIWLAGAVASLVWFSTAYTCFSRRIRRSCAAPHSGDLAVFEQMRGNHRLHMACSSHVSTPMLIGILRPVIVLPQLAYVHSGKGGELANILRHELMHYRRKDVLYKWLAVAVTSLHWFNPLMLPIRREISRACELSCDEAVISGMPADEKQSYGNTLLALSANRKLPSGILATTLCEDKKELKERLISIMQHKKKSKWAVALMLALALLLTGCAAVLGNAGSAVIDENTAQYTKAGISDIAAPLQSAAEELVKTCDFPVLLPTYLPSPSDGKEWSVSPEVKDGSFSIQLYQLPLGNTSRARSDADWYGVLSGNVGEPSEQPLETQFRTGDNITINNIRLPDEINGREYIGDPDAAGGTAITWQKDGWRFFVTAYPDGGSSTANYARQIIGAIKDSGQALTGSQGMLSFIYNGNMPMTEASWEAEPGVWYAINAREPNDVIPLLQSMKKIGVNPAGSSSGENKIYYSYDIGVATRLEASATSSLKADLDGDGEKETAELIATARDSRQWTFVYRDGETEVSVPVFEGYGFGVGTSIAAGHIVGTDSVDFLVSLDTASTIGSQHYELYSLWDGILKKVDVSKITDGTPFEISVDESNQAARLTANGSEKAVRLSDLELSAYQYYGEELFQNGEELCQASFIEMKLQSVPGSYLPELVTTEMIAAVLPNDLTYLHTIYHYTGGEWKIRSVEFYDMNAEADRLVEEIRRLPK